MEESNEVHSEDNKVSPEKNKKRQLKTPAQVTALEEFYDEHKYPSEEMKSQLAEHIGLTEKQVSGWFCHRRLKDKRMSRDEVQGGNGRQDRSSGVFQDRGSGLRQDSCGSTKQGDHRHADPREVESRRLDSQRFPAVDDVYERRSHYTGNFSGDDTSSESSSSLQEGFTSQRVDAYGMGSSKHLTQNGVALPNSSKGAKSMGYKPAGYLKVKGEVENVAITAVKRQLGRYYREEGPPLGVQFQPLPPGAFESSFRESVREPYDVGDPALLRSPDASGVRKQPSLGTRYEVDDSQIGSMEVHARLNNIYGSDSRDSKSQRHFKQKSCVLSHTDSFPGRNASLDKYEDPSPVHKRKKKDRSIAKHVLDGVRSDPPPRPYGDNFASERTEAWLQEYVPRNEHLKSTPPNFIARHNDSVGAKEKGGYRRMAKEERFHMEKKAQKECGEATDELGVSKRAREQKTFVGKASIPLETKGSALEMPSSFSDDESAETNSSLS